MEVKFLSFIKNSVLCDPPSVNISFTKHAYHNSAQGFFIICALNITFI